MNLNSCLATQTLQRAVKNLCGMIIFTLMVLLKKKKTPYEQIYCKTLDL